MRATITLTLFTLFFVTVSAQSKYKISFDSVKTIIRSKTGDVIYPVFLNASLGTYKDSGNYSVSVTPDSKSGLPGISYELDFASRTFDKLDTSDSRKNIGYLTIKKDSLEDRQRTIILNLEVKNEDGIDKGNGGKSSITITVDGIKPGDSLKAYNYLAYIGTNFDLVDGPRAKNLFFASNIFLPPARKSAVGLYLSLYGNRTMTSTDTTGDIIRTTKIVSMSDTTLKRYTEQSTLLRTHVSDNLGAYISPLVNLGRASSKTNLIQLYYSPSLEFVWRRTKINSLFSNSINMDSIIERGRFNGKIDYSNTSSSSFNEFVFNVGLLGFIVVHESRDISVRVHGSTGYSSTYQPVYQGPTKGSLNNGLYNSNYTNTGDIFFCGRAWITESGTGVTLQAEITNTLKHPRPFYGVTLSKAINFQNLSKIFQPIITR